MQSSVMAIEDLPATGWQDVTQEVTYERKYKLGCDCVVHRGKVIAVLNCGGTHAVVFAPRRDGGRVIMVYQKKAQNA